MAALAENGTALSVAEPDTYISPRRGIKRTDNVSDVLRKADRELRDRWGCKRYVAAKKCPRCGTLNYRRKQDGTCLACSMKEVPR